MSEERRSGNNLVLLIGKRAMGLEIECEDEERDELLLDRSLIVETVEKRRVWVLRRWHPFSNLAR